MQVLERLTREAVQLAEHDNPDDDPWLEARDAAMVELLYGSVQTTKLRTISLLLSLLQLQPVLQVDMQLVLCGST